MWPVAHSVRWPDADGQRKHVLEWTIWFECGRSRSVWLNADWRPCLLHHPNFYLFVTPAVSRLLSSPRLLSTFPLIWRPVSYNLSGTRNNFRVENKMWPKMNYSSLKITRSVVPPARPAHCCRLSSVNLEFWAAGLGAKLSSARREHSISLEASGPCNATFTSNIYLRTYPFIVERRLVAWNFVDSTLHFYSEKICEYNTICVTLHVTCLWCRLWVDGIMTRLKQFNVLTWFLRLISTKSFSLF